jgi:hypothetical protein
VVCGQRMMQAASDIYLGWTAAKIPTTHHFYWRQLRDMKRSVESRRWRPPRSPSTPCLRVDAGPGPRAIGGPDRDRRLSG